MPDDFATRILIFSVDFTAPLEAHETIRHIGI